MFKKLRDVFAVPELRQKILLTLLFLAIYRVGWHIPLPVVDMSKTYFGQSTEDSDTGGDVRGAGTFGGFIEQVSLFSASQLSQATIFGLGIMPYISASIIFQLLGSVWGPLERLQKEGESGRRKINEYTRYATVAICLVQSWMYVSYMRNINPEFAVNQASEFPELSLSWQIVCVLTMTCGTVFLMWLGEQIDQYGIGNGISLLIMAGILAQLPNSLIDQLRPVWNEGLQLGGNAEKLVVMALLFVAVVVGVVFMYQGQRRITTQSAKHVRGRRVYGGTRQYLPLRVNQAGVMPIIFASSLLLFPSMIFQWLGWFELASSFQRGTSFIYNVAYVVLIYFFCYFWTAITFNPKDMANNLKDFGSFIPGYRPGKRTADYLEKVMVRITYVGAGFLAVVAIIPTIVSTSMGVDMATASFYGGTGLLIAVSVAFDLVQKIDSHLVMRNYKGLLEG